jgi:hypothetical protein
MCRAYFKTCFASSAEIFVNHNGVGFFISYDGVINAAFHTWWLFTLIANYGHI